MSDTARRLCGLIGASLIVLAVTGCADPVVQRGNLPEQASLKDIKPGVTDKQTVTRLLGSPSTVGTFDKDTWYYISQRTEEVAFFKPTLLDQQVVTIDFDRNGIVRDINHRGMDDRHPITPIARATPAPGREFSLMEQLIGNFGKFNGSSGDTQRPGQ
jgi:outer membrane protein assembly factor BamE (lipoprotein component of BamABCDE complex)